MPRLRGSAGWKLGLTCGITGWLEQKWEGTGKGTTARSPHLYSQCPGGPSPTQRTSSCTNPATAPSASVTEPVHSVQWPRRSSSLHCCHRPSRRASPEPRGAAGIAGDGPLLLLVRAVTLQTRTVSNNALWPAWASRSKHLGEQGTVCTCPASHRPSSPARGPQQGQPFVPTTRWGRPGC